MCRNVNSYGCDIFDRIPAFKRIFSNANEGTHERILYPALKQIIWITGCVVQYCAVYKLANIRDKEVSRVLQDLSG